MNCRRPRLLWLLAGMVLLLPGCGSDGDDASQAVASQGKTTGTLPPGTGHPIEVTAGDLYFEPTELEVPAGPVAFTLVNEGAQAHSLLIEKVGGLRLDVAAKGDHDEGSIALEPGEYTFVCDIPGHRAVGMQGTLTVQ